tara:strand:- start:1304 stop:1858 length:555 start_codon:yes stop_codon:yes gene_type:complete
MWKSIDYQNILQAIYDWFFNGGMKIVIILIIAWLIIRIGRFVISRSIKAFVKTTGKIKGGKAFQDQRAKTLRKVLKSTFSIIVWTAAFLTILPELGVNIAPLLAGAGLVGLAIGMGAKNLIQDYLAGLFILLEDQYRVGEKVEINKVKGEVVYLTLRRTVLKDKGTFYHISNGQIKTTSNFSRK